MFQRIGYYGRYGVASGLFEDFLPFVGAQGKEFRAVRGLFQRPDRSKVNSALSVLVNANFILFCHESVFFPVFKQRSGVAGGRFE